MTDLAAPRSGRAQDGAPVRFLRGQEPSPAGGRRDNGRITVGDGAQHSELLLAPFLAEVLDHLAAGIVIVGRGWEALFVNRAARSMMRKGLSLRVAKGRLLSGNQKTEAQLGAAMHRVWGMTASARRHCADMITIERPGGGQPLQVCVSPLVAGGEVVAGLFLHDPAGRTAPSAQLFKKLYGLTPAEARVALVLLHGERLANAARGMGLSINTVKSHVKEVFRKTGSTRQAELIRLLSTGLTTLDLVF